MADQTATILQLIQPIKLTDPKTYSALEAITAQLQGVYIQLNPLVAAAQATSSSSLAPIAPVAFDFSFQRTTVRFTWSSVTGAAQYEVRQGSSWDSATLRFRSPSLQADIDPPIYGTYTFLIKAINSSGTYSDTATSLTLTVPTIPFVVVSAQVIDNNVLLFWTEPESSFEISFYEVFRNGVSIGTLDGTFFTFFETVGGSYLYHVIATDVAGNESPAPPADLVVDVNAPPDFELQDQTISTFAGTKTNAKIDRQTDCLVVCVDTTKTYQDHFIDNAWASPSAQVAAGYPLWLTPAEATAQYEEKVDYGTIISNIIVAVTYTKRETTGTTTVLVELNVSDDDIVYSGWTAGSVQYFTHFRYVKYRLTFTGSDDKSLAEICDLTFNINVKREQDGDVIAAVSTDAGGTSVTFNKSFKDIDSITATPITTSDYRCVINFTDVPNPTGFKVLVFNAAGARVSIDVRWIARGIV